MCYGYERSSGWWKEAEERRLELLKRQERERQEQVRESLRTAQDEELRRYERTLIRRESGVKTKK